MRIPSASCNRSLNRSLTVMYFTAKRFNENAGCYVRSRFLLICWMSLHREGIDQRNHAEVSESYSCKNLGSIPRLGADLVEWARKLVSDRQTLVLKIRRSTCHEKQDQQRMSESDVCPLLQSACNNSPKRSESKTLERSQMQSMCSWRECVASCQGWETHQWAKNRPCMSQKLLVYYSC